MFCRCDPLSRSDPPTNDSAHRAPKHSAWFGCRGEMDSRTRLAGFAAVAVSRDSGSPLVGRAQSVRDVLEPVASESVYYGGESE